MAFNCLLLLEKMKFSEHETTEMVLSVLSNVFWSNALNKPTSSHKFTNNGFLLFVPFRENEIFRTRGDCNDIGRPYLFFLE